MAKNISLMGADYPDVPAVQLPQTGGGTATFYDIQVIDNLDSDSSTDALSAKQGKVLNNKIPKYTMQSKVSPSIAPYAAGNVTFDVPSGGTSILAIIPCGINANSNDNTLGVPTNLNFSTKTLTIRAIGTVTQSYTVQAWIVYI